MPVHPSYKDFDVQYFAELVSFALKRSIETYLALGGRVHFERIDHQKLPSVPEDGWLTITDGNGAVLFSAGVPGFLVDALDEWEFVH